MKKRYEVKGMMEWHPVFKIGRGTLQVSFTGGYLCGGARTSASFETSDPVVQKVIECSKPYRSQKIRLVYTEASCQGQDSRSQIPEARDQIPDIGDQKPETRDQMPEARGQSPDSEANPQPPKESEIFEYTKEEEIYEYLQHTHGIHVEQMSTKGSCYDEAERLGITLRKKT